MFLKKIRIDGFKSFAKPVVIDFPAPITAIVGPNGSGKSNIVDAIRWAMGEQSAKSLRGSKMSDIIFAGSIDYQPRKKASVTLYFDNSSDVFPDEKKQVRIKREVTDDGQSDYYMNGSSCRLKDIEELLMDTGLGKDAYSIVGQGRIDSILNSKPEKLRELFEEAAGIVKHKSRKREAENRLEKTQIDLQRIKDLVWELDKQVKPLKRSAKKARRYRQLREELEVLEVNLLLERWQNNSVELEDIKKEEKILYDKLFSLEKELSEIEKTLEQKNNELETEEEIIEELQNNLYKTKIKREQAENNLKVLAERNRGLTREKKKLTEQIEILEVDKKRLQTKKQDLESNIKVISEEEKDLEKELGKLEEKIDKVKYNLQEKKDELFSKRNLILNDNMEKNDIISELEQCKEKNRYLELEINRIAEKRHKISIELDDIIILKEKLQKELKQLEKDLMIKNNELITYRKQEKDIDISIEQVKNDIEKIKNNISHKFSRLKVLKDMEDDYQGYFRGVKNVLKEQEKISGIIGVVADLIDVEKKYELAIETALGAKLQNIVTEDDAVARSAVKYLKSTKGGRATFLPLNMVRGNKARIEKLNIDSMDGYIGLASDIINYEERLDQVMYSMLGKTLVAEDIDTATEIAKKIRSNLKIVTLDGDYINSTGAITGGSQKNNNKGLLGRTREIEELKEEVSILKENFDSKQEQLDSFEKKKEDINNLIEEKNKEINQSQFRKNDLNKDILNSEKEQNRLESELKIIDRDFEEYHKQLGNTDKLIQQLKEKLAKITDEHTKEKDEIDSKETELEKLEIVEEELNEKVTDYRVKLATVSQKKQGVQAERNNIINEIKNRLINIDEHKKQLNHLEGKLTEIEERRNEFVEMEKDFAEQIAKMDKEYNNRSRLFKQKEMDVKEYQERFNHKQDNLSQVKDDHHKIELKLTRIEDKNIQISDRLMEEYEVSVEKGISERIEITNYTKALQKIKEFKDAIKKLGPVNIGAIKEYEELMERLEYLKAQQEDLLEARSSIEKVIGDLEKHMNKHFYQTFAEVKEQFEMTFEQLFNGGKAELRLTRPEDLLVTGVEIEAQPPGKQLKKLSLMSGGERALTAIALVFAFLNVNPSPMYILDEIDAPLDDANVKRFANYLKEYSGYVQFLLITHNKLMMTEANVMYGITMEEKGVSKLVSLRLDEEIA
ncbi:MAG: chromosome segregation protein SMC [Bacillota bacterium]